MRLLAYLPDDPALRGALEEILRRSPKTRRIEIAALGADPWNALEKEVAGADPRHGFVIVDPPRATADLKRLDDLCRRASKGKGPHAVFFAPPGKKQEPAWREAMKEPYRHFHASRRSHPFAKPTEKALGKAVT